MNKIAIGLVIALVVVLGAVYLFSANRSPTLSMATGASASQGSLPPNGTRNTRMVTVTPTGFSPSSLTIKAGETVTWTNNSGVDVSINSDPHPVHNLYPPLNLGLVSDQNSASLTFDQPGSYGYHNHLNPGQTGTIIVQ